MRIVYSSKALRQLDAILTYLDVRNPQGTDRVKARIRSFVAILKEHPLAGHTTDRAGQRRLVISPYPYAIFYRMSDDAVMIQSIRHTSRRQT